jgi:hypothetical protein
MASRRGKIGLTTVPALRPGEILWDTELKRFGARCRDRGISYFVKVQINREQTWLTIGRHGPLTPTEARAKARQILGEIDSGRDPRRERDARRTMPTPGAFAERWLTQHVAMKRKPATLEAYRRLLSLHVLPTLGDTRLEC